MRKLTLSDIQAIGEYEKTRDAFRRRVIELKESRRVLVGDRVSLVFENRETALSQVQEMLRAERIVEPGKIQFEIDTYNALIPDVGELSATLFIEITDAADVRRELDRLLGLDRPGAVSFEFEGAGRAAARFEAGHSTEERISAVHYVKFPLTGEQRRVFVEGSGEIALVIDHPSYRHRAVLSPAQREALAADLAG